MPSKIVKKKCLLLKMNSSVNGLNKWIKCQWTKESITIGSCERMCCVNAIMLVLSCWCNLFASVVWLPWLFFAVEEHFLLGTLCDFFTKRSTNSADGRKLSMLWTRRDQCLCLKNQICVRRVNHIIRLPWHGRIEETKVVNSLRRRDSC